MVKCWALAEFDEEFADVEEFKNLIRHVIEQYDKGEGIKGKHLTHIYITGVGQDGFEYKADLVVIEEKVEKVKTNFKV